MNVSFLLTPESARVGAGIVRCSLEESANAGTSACFLRQCKDTTFPLRFTNVSQDFFHKFLLVAVVAVKKWVLKWAKNNSIIIYIYIIIELFFGCGGRLNRTATTATLQHCNETCVLQKIFKKMKKSSRKIRTPQRKFRTFAASNRKGQKGRY